MLCLSFTKGALILVNWCSFFNTEDFSFSMFQIFFDEEPFLFDAGSFLKDIQALTFSAF